MKFRILAAAVALPLILSGCGLLAEVGVLDESYKGSFVRGDAYAALCAKIGGTWSWKAGEQPKCDKELF